MSSTDPETDLVPVLIPELGAECQLITFVQWLVDDGEPVLLHDRIAEVIVAGILFHVRAPAEGILHRSFETEGARLSPGDSLGAIDTSVSLED